MHLKSSCLLVTGESGVCIFLPEGQATSLHVVVSVRGIVLVVAHFVSLLAAPVLNNWI